jgi:hypothetical protein
MKSTYKSGNVAAPELAKLAIDGKRDMNPSGV